MVIKPGLLLIIVVLHPVKREGRPESLPMKYIQYHLFGGVMQVDKSFKKDKVTALNFSLQQVKAYVHGLKPGQMTERGEHWFHAEFWGKRRW